MSAERAAELFAARFGGRPAVVASAPGRVNLIGEHVDYNGGAVLPIAIARRTWVAMSPAVSGASRGVSVAREDAAAFRVDSPAPAGEWWDYVHGTLRELRTLGIRTADVDFAVVSEVPPGAGLSSSAALEVASALAGVVCFGGLLVDAWDHLGEVTHRAEASFVGVSCGIMDQAASTHATAGHALHLRCDSGRMTQIPFDRLVLVVDTATPRELRTSAYNERRRSCERALASLRRDVPDLAFLADATPEMVAGADLPDEERRCARHVVTECERVDAFVARLQAGEPLGSLLYASHESLRTDYACSSAELDWVVEFAASRSGVEGARMTGAGWGGCAIAIGTTDGVSALAAEVAPAFEERWGRAPRTWLTRAEEGADVDEAESFSRMLQAKSERR